MQGGSLHTSDNLALWENPQKRKVNVLIQISDDHPRPFHVGVSPQDMSVYDDVIFLKP